MEWIKCVDRMPIHGRLLLLFVDGDYEFGQLREDGWYIYTMGTFKKLYDFQEVTHYSNLHHPTE